MNTIRTRELYEKFVNFPAKYSIVRNGHVNDAFNLVVFEILFKNFHNIKRLDHSNQEHRELLEKTIVPPPDDYIDIFFEEDNVDEKKYHIVQVKNSSITQVDIETNFTMMEKSIKLFLTKPKDLKRSLKNIIGETDFSKQYEKSCIYYVVHIGDTKFIRNQKKNQIIITSQELDILKEGIELESVPKESFQIDIASNFIVNNFVDNKEFRKETNRLPQSILCNFSGYDLALLNNKYSNTLVGNNILYGQNLRESLAKKSKTFESMVLTINKEPDLFLFYNNGITILAESFDAKTKHEKEIITLEKFSIINGAQTTSTLGAYLKEAEILNETEKIENLKKVFVLTKIFKIDICLENSEMISERIRIYNNTQTPLSSRDMVSIRKEQKKIRDRFLEFEQPPHISIAIKKGVEHPSYPQTYPHQRISNETLAQLVLCGFFSEPFNAKDKKAKIFDNENRDNVTLNDIYHKIFDINEGILFKKSNVELNELLFVYRLHNDSKNFQKRTLKEQLNHLSQTAYTDDIDKETREKRIERVKRNMEITNVCLFYNIAAYFEIKRQLDGRVDNNNDLIFDYRRYYSDKDYKEQILKDFIRLVYNDTVNIVRENSGFDNVNNWIRVGKNQNLFLEKLKNLIIDKLYDYKEKYIGFISKYKITNI